VHPPGPGPKVERRALASVRDLSSRELADTLTADLVQSRQVEVVDRVHLAAELKEQALGASGYEQPASVARLGKLLGPSGARAKSPDHSTHRWAPRGRSMGARPCAQRGDSLGARGAMTR
jgi:hypothetical protein